MNLTKSIDFLLDKAGDVLKYRLHKEILKDISKSEEENLLEKVLQTPFFKLVQSYAKPSGYIGNGMHSWDNWRGVRLHETPLQDGETAARLLCYYSVPSTHPLIKNFVSAMRDDKILEKEFSYIPPEVTRYETRFVGLKSGFCLMTLIYAMQAMLGYGEYVIPFQNMSLEAFRSILPLSSLNDIAKVRKSNAKYNYPYIEADTFFPCQYHLETLAYTSKWKTQENRKLMANALNHYNEITQESVLIHVKIGNRYYAPFPLNMANSPIRAFKPDLIDTITYRRLLTEIAMLGVGDSVNILRQTAENICDAIDNDGIL